MRPFRAAGVLRGLVYAAAICSGACGRQSAPLNAGATGINAAATASVATTTAVAPPAGVVAPTGPVAPATGTAPATGSASATAAPNCLPAHDGFLRLRMRGDRNMDIDWHDAEMLCDGGPRPGQRGIRLTFAGPGRHGEHSLRFVFGIATAPGVRDAHNVPTNVTVIFEGEKKLYSTAGDGKCTIDELSEQPVATDGTTPLQRISARGFCTAPATAIAGKSGLLVSRFDFAGRAEGDDAADAPSDVKP
jgi:hypothetical protein